MEKYYALRMINQHQNYYTKIVFPIAGVQLEIKYEITFIS